MKKLFARLSIGICLSVAAFAQTTTPPPNPATTQPTFTLSGNVLALPSATQSSAATDIGLTFSVTNNWQLRADTIIAPTVSTQGYYGGLQYIIPTAKLLAKTNLNSNSFQFYLSGGAGEVHVTANGNTLSHFGGLLGGGVNYDPTGTGKFSVNLAEVRWAPKLNGTNESIVVETGLKLGW
jgi:hypothetical protein